MPFLSAQMLTPGCDGRSCAARRIRTAQPQGNVSLLWLLGKRLLLRGRLWLGCGSLIRIGLNFPSTAAHLVQFGLRLGDLRFGVFEGAVSRRLPAGGGIALA